MFFYISLQMKMMKKAATGGLNNTSKSKILRVKNQNQSKNVY